MAKNYLGDWVKAAMGSKGLTRARLAELMGYQNISRGCRRIVAVERGEIPDSLFLSRLVCALGLDPEEVHQVVLLAEQEQEDEYQAWLDEPIEPVLLLKIVPAVVMKISPPEHLLSEETLIDWACGKVRGYPHPGALKLSRRDTVWIGRDGGVIRREIIGRDRPARDRRQPDFGMMIAIGENGRAGLIGPRGL